MRPGDCGLAPDPLTPSIQATESELIATIKTAMPLEAARLTRTEEVP
jgi:hypothetical protein